MKCYERVNLILALGASGRPAGVASMPRKQKTPMYWQNGSYDSKIDHITEHDLMLWSEREYIKHYSQKSGAFSVAELTERKKKHDK